MDADLARIAASLARFAGDDLTRTLARIEQSAKGLSAAQAEAFVAGTGAERSTLAAAGQLKRLAGQINVTIHALGILRCLPHILELGEVVEYVSLGAGNTGRPFDLETNLRVAEFKFITWRGGSETIRQNGVFKDYVQLAGYPTTKRKHLYLLGTDQALRFLRGRRALVSVLSRNEPVRRAFVETFGEEFVTVGQYFAAHADTVEITDVSAWLGELSDLSIPVGDVE